MKTAKSCKGMTRTELIAKACHTRPCYEVTWGANSSVLSLFAVRGGVQEYLFGEMKQPSKVILRDAEAVHRRTLGKGSHHRPRASLPLPSVKRHLQFLDKKPKIVLFHKMKNEMPLYNLIFYFY